MEERNQHTSSSSFFSPETGQARGKFRPTTKRNPCPICSRFGDCSMSQDGVIVCCRKIADGAFDTRPDKKGRLRYLHRLGVDRATPLPPVPAANETEVERADVDTLNLVYNAFLSALSLSKTHRDNLRQRGLSDEQIDQRGYRSHIVEGRSKLARQLRDRFGDDRLLRVPGFFVKEGDRGHYLTISGSLGLLIPVRDLAGRIVAIRIRRDEGKPKYTWLSTGNRGGAGSGSPVHIPKSIAQVNNVVRVTEGELKADIATALDGMLTLSLPGVGNWRGVIEVLKSLACSSVRLAIDMDARENPHVAKALDELAAGLVDAGFELELEQWSWPPHKGIDDAIVGKGAIDVLYGQAAIAAIGVTVTQGGGDDSGPPKILRGDSWEGEGHNDELGWRPFPVHALPLIVSEFVQAISESLQVDPVAVALPALAAIAGSIGNSRVIRLSRTWTEPAMMYACLIAEPSTRKSAALEWATAPVKKWNAERLKEHRDAKEKYDHELECWMAAHGKEVSANAGLNKRPQPPIKRRALVGDITVETLIREHVNNPRGLFAPRDELRGWFASFGKYAKSGAGSDECFWLEVKGKDYHYDRKTGDQTSISIEHLNITVVGTTQPETWKGMAAKAMYDSGFIARLLLAYPPKRLGRSRVDDPPEDAIKLYDFLLRSLLELDWSIWALDSHPVPMVPDSAALKVWDPWCEAGRREQFKTEGAVSAMIGKLEAYCARFALCFAVCDLVTGGKENIVHESHIRNAITIAEWFRQEILRIYSFTAMGDRETEAMAILQKVIELGGSITPRELWSSNRIKWGKGTTPKDRSAKAREALDALAKEGRLTRDQRGRYHVSTSGGRHGS